MVVKLFVDHDPHVDPNRRVMGKIIWGRFSSHCSRTAICCDQGSNFGALREIFWATAAATTSKQLIVKSARLRMRFPRFLRSGSRLCSSAGGADVKLALLSGAAF